MYIYTNHRIYVRAYSYSHTTPRVYMYICIHTSQCARTHHVSYVYIYTSGVCVYTVVCSVCAYVCIQTPEVSCKPYNLDQSCLKQHRILCSHSFYFWFESVYERFASTRGARNKTIADVQVTRCLEGGVKVKSLNPVEGAHTSDFPAGWPRSSIAVPAGTV